MDNDLIGIWFWGADELRDRIAQVLGHGYLVRPVRELSRLPADGTCDVVLFDVGGNKLASELDVDDAWKQLSSIVHDLELPPVIIALVRADDVESVGFRLLEQGVYDFVSNSDTSLDLSFVIRHARQFRHLQESLLRRTLLEDRVGELDDVLARCAPMRRIVSRVRRIAPCDVNVLLTGEAGTGKELIARAIHRLSPRADQPFVTFSCTNLPEKLVEDELFGHEEGAFTSAAGRRCGRLEAADHGTLFVDEIGNMTPALQARLIRVLKEGCFERLGTDTMVSVDVRLICATRGDLRQMVAAGSFLEDLYWRLAAIELRLPPLREQREAIAMFAQHLLLRFAHQFNKPVTDFSPVALRALDEYAWPGNVRELENVIQQAVVMTEGSTVDLKQLPEEVCEGFTENANETARGGVRNYDVEVREFKQRLIARILRECGGGKAEAACRLGLNRTYLYRLMRHLPVGTDGGEKGFASGSETSHARKSPRRSIHRAAG